MNNGGAAFPQIPFINNNGEICTVGQYFEGASGMVLRDYFAAKFAASLVVPTSKDIDVANPDWPAKDTIFAEVIASYAYKFADAMLKERSKTYER